jgi:hypothetical protein
MLRKHINHEGVFPVDVKSRPPEIGPMPCPQPGCQSSDGGGAYSKGFVVYEEYGGFSGDYVTSNPCKCCDGKGQLFEGERAYEQYCVALGVRDLGAGYPDPHPMSREVYESPRVLEAIKRRSDRQPETKKDAEGCFIATAVYGSYEAPSVTVLRRFRDERLRTNAMGRMFIRVYYSGSPRMAIWLRGQPAIASLVRRTLDCVVKKLT